MQAIHLHVDIYNYMYVMFYLYTVLDCLSSMTNCAINGSCKDPEMDCMCRNESEGDCYKSKPVVFAVAPSKLDNIYLNPCTYM